MEVDYSSLELKKKRGPKGKYSDEVISQLHALANKGYNQTSISKATGIPQRSISMLLRRK